MSYYAERAAHLTMYVVLAVCAALVTGYFV